MDLPWVANRRLFRNRENFSLPEDIHGDRAQPPPFPGYLENKRGEGKQREMRSKIVCGREEGMALDDACELRRDIQGFWPSGFCLPFLDLEEVSTTAAVSKSCWKACMKIEECIYKEVGENVFDLPPWMQEGGGYQQGEWQTLFRSRRCG